MILKLHEQRTIVPDVCKEEQVVAYSGQNSPFLSEFLDLLFSYNLHEANVGSYWEILHIILKHNAFSFRMTTP